MLFNRSLPDKPKIRKATDADEMNPLVADYLKTSPGDRPYLLDRYGLIPKQPESVHPDEKSALRKWLDLVYAFNRP